MEFKVLLKNKKESDSEWIERLETELNSFYKEIKHDSASWGYEAGIYNNRPMYILRKESQKDKKVGF